MDPAISRSIFPAAMACAIASAASSAVTTASYAPCGSTDGIGSFRAAVSYAHSGGASATLTIALLNDTPVASGGYITGLALNGGMGVGSMTFVSCTNRSFANAGSPVAASPFGNFMAGAAVGGNWTGGGSPVAGIAVGMTATFVFTMTGAATDLAMLTAEDCLRQGGYAMAVRFRGGVGGWSDKVIGCAMPAPGAIAMLAAAGVVGTRRRPR